MRKCDIGYNAVKLNIFLAEDSLTDSSTIINQLNHWAKQKNLHINIDCVNELSYKEVSIACLHDVLFLDIEVPVINGLDFAKLVRDHNQHISIIFFTSHKELAIYGYDVQAMSYIIKPSMQSDIDKCMDRFYQKRLQNKSTKIIIPTTTTEIDCYYPNQIVYIEAVKHYTNLYTLDDCIPYRLPFKKINNLLPKPTFFNCYRSFTINLNYVCGVNNNEIILIHDKKVLLSKNYVYEFKRCLLNLHKGD